ncbi:MAG: CPBP family intramembrane metalloprotease [Treponema sp.]|nr:CPBP family intramembrane metalloprotease [Treponema sp.]
MENKIYPKIKNVVFLCLLFLGLQLVLGFLSGLLLVKMNLPGDSVVSGIILIFINLAAFGIVLFIGFRKTRRNFFEVFKLRGVSAFLWISVIIFTPGFIIVISELDNLLNFLLPMPELFNDIFDSMIAGHTLIIAVIYIGIVPAFAEEFFFRGLILDGFTRNYSERKAIIVSALFFGLVHLNPWQFLSAFLMGLAASWICIKTRSIWLCVYIHFFNNTLYTITVRYENFIPIKGFNSNFVEPGVFQPLWFTLSGFALMAAGTFMLLKGTNILPMPLFPMKRRYAIFQERR